MRHLLIWAVRIYRMVVPPQRRRSCLFRESCSRHVERIAVEQGAGEGRLGSEAIELCPFGKAS